GLIEDAAERLELAGLNLRAGAKARNSTAYALAVRCYRNAVDLLGPDAWEKSAQLASDAHRRLAEALCLAADYPAAFDVLGEALLHAVSNAERAKLHALQANAYGSMGQVQEALALGRDAIESFGVELPADPAVAERVLQQ